jgi:hypothetical protein
MAKSKSAKRASGRAGLHGRGVCDHVPVGGDVVEAAWSGHAREHGVLDVLDAGSDSRDLCDAMRAVLAASAVSEADTFCVYRADVRGEAVRVVSSRPLANLPLTLRLWEAYAYADHL